ncbi:uncharacterized protein LOC130744991 [Lotus japonicus]|uniref:uncharacterized protein LOC130744991 n=1 Tax=Lotus japonicus TaxID=34305 RepID=UPI00258A3C87|nr:uncharacterized protein LOC130744991 [Lotus japonicus]
MKETLRNLWRGFGTFEIRDIGPNLFTFRFDDKQDRDRVLLGGPWNYNHFVLVLKVLEVDESPSQVPLDRVPFWVQVHDMPVGLHTEEVARSLGVALGGFMDWDPSERRGHGAFLRVKASVDVSKPLLRFKLLGRGHKEPLRVTFRYERLANLCYRCGHMDHLVKHCRSKDRGPFPFGLGLKVEPADLSSHRKRASSSASSQVSDGGGPSSGAVPVAPKGPAPGEKVVRGDGGSMEVHAAHDEGGTEKSRVNIPTQQVACDATFPFVEPHADVVGKKRNADAMCDDVVAPPLKKVLFDAISAEAVEQSRRAQ